jgi:hypothetical protein
VKVRYAIIGFILCFQSWVGYCQGPQFAIGGTVHDASGSLLPGATVSLLLPGTAPVPSALTDANGEFKLVLPGPGSYQVEVQDEGFAPYTASAIANDVAPVATLEIVLKVAATTQTVEVTADTLAAETTAHNSARISTRKKSKVSR